MVADADLKVYSVEEVAKKKGRDNCWLIIQNKVYDVSKFLDDVSSILDRLTAVTIYSSWLTY